MTDKARESLTDHNSPPADVTVVVPTWDRRRWEDLASCLLSLARQTLPPGEIIVVVDHNPELLASARASFPDARVVENRHSRGVVGARNTGIELARGEIVVLTDDDTRADRRWLEYLHGCFADPAVVGATGALIPRWPGAQPRWFPPEFYWVVGCSYTGLPKHVAPVRNPIAANMAVRRHAVRAAGGFREGSTPREIRSRGIVIAGGHALEDTELGIRMGRRWRETVWLYHPRATVHHTVKREQATLGYLARRSFEEGAAKAHLARSVGSQDGLESERRYLAAVVPRGLARGLRDFLTGDPSGAARAGAIIVGLAAAAFGYSIAALTSRLGAGQSGHRLTPMSPGDPPRQERSSH